MKLVFNFLIFSLCFALSTILAQEKDLSGSWVGKLKLPNGIQLSIVFNLQKTGDEYSATLDSPDQGAKGIPCGKINIENDSIRIDVPSIFGNYNGKINYDDKKITGYWNQAGSSFELNLQYTEEIAAPKRPQEPKPPFPYNVEEVRFRNEKDNITLAGTLTYPKENKKYPAVVLISGSGAQNRDEELFNHKPFLVIADYLTKNGFAVLRFDDRGYGQSEGNHALSTILDFAEDVRAAVNYLKSREEIDENKIGLIGHSEGGMIASVVAADKDDIAFVVLMAGPGVPGDSLLYLQTELIYKSVGQSTEKIQQILKGLREVYAILKSDEEEAFLKEKLKIKFQDLFNQLTEEEKKQYGNIDSFADMQMRILMSPWFRNFLRFNTASYLEKVICPVLAINGEKDLQVPPKENLSAIENALKKGGNKNYVIKEIPGLNHLFQTSKYGTIGEYGVIEETISPVALETITVWLKAITEE